MKKALVKCASILLSVLLLASIAYAESAGSTLQELYQQAELLMVQGDYAGAAAQFEALSAYSDASQMAMYCKAIQAAENGLYTIGIEALENLGDFKDCKQLAQYYTARQYEDTAAMFDIATASDTDLNTAASLYNEAASIFADLALYKDSLTHYGSCKNGYDAVKAEQEQRKNEALEAAYQDALSKENSGNYEDAIAIFQTLGNYKDSKERIAACRDAQTLNEMENAYQEAVELQDNHKYLEAAYIYEDLRDYKDSAERLAVCTGMFRVISIKQATYGVQGKTEWLDNEREYRYTYNSEGFRISEEFIATFPTKETFILGANGQIISGSKTGQDYTSKTEYDEHGNLIKETVSNKDGSSSIITYQYTYGENGEILTKVHYSDGKLYRSYSYQYKYDERGRLEEMQELLNGELSGTYTYYYRVGNMIEKVIRIGAPVKTSAGTWVYRTEQLYEYE